jgi:hypothetical protein
MATAGGKTTTPAPAVCWSAPVLVEVRSVEAGPRIEDYVEPADTRRPPYFGEREPTAQSIEATLAGTGGLEPVRTVLFSYGRRLWDYPDGHYPGGRCRNFDEATAARMMDKLEAFCRQERATTGHLPVAKRIENFVTGELLPAEGVTSSYRIASERIVAPVLRKLKPPRRKNKL